jgi:biotin synthase
MQRSEILDWLRETDPARLAELWRLADRVRQENVGGEVHLRGLVELSNHCVRLCGYCGLRAGNLALVRYRMSDDEVMACVQKAVEFGYGTVVLQSGEDPGLTVERIVALVERIKSETSLAVTLSLGERDDEELAAWRRAGADRYLLRFETSNRALFDRIHPPRSDASSDRLAILATLGRLGYEVGSGVMIGIPGQT